MKNDPSYEWWEYACHEGNTIVPNYTNTSRHERANPVQDAVVPAIEIPQGPPQPNAKPAPAKLSADMAKQLAGRWVGRPQLKTIDYDIEIEFTPNADGTVIGRLLRTTLPKERPINQPFRGFRINGRQMNWTFPNTQEWTFAGTLADDGSAIAGTTNSAQGGIPLTFRKR
jgi:hypothetical protein